MRGNVKPWGVNERAFTKRRLRVGGVLLSAFPRSIFTYVFTTALAENYTVMFINTHVFFTLHLVARLLL